MYIVNRSEATAVGTLHRSRKLQSEATSPTCYNSTGDNDSANDSINGSQDGKNEDTAVSSSAPSSPTKRVKRRKTAVSHPLSLLFIDQEKKTNVLLGLWEWPCYYPARSRGKHPACIRSTLCHSFIRDSLIRSPWKRLSNQPFLPMVTWWGMFFRILFWSIVMTLGIRYWIRTPRILVLLPNRYAQLPLHSIINRSWPVVCWSNWPKRISMNTKTKY